MLHSYAHTSCGHIVIAGDLREPVLSTDSVTTTSSFDHFMNDGSANVLKKNANKITINILFTVFIKIVNISILLISTHPNERNIYVHWVDLQSSNYSLLKNNLYKSSWNLISKFFKIVPSLLTLSALFLPYLSSSSILSHIYQSLTAKFLSS